MGRTRKPLAMQKGDLTIERQDELRRTEQLVQGNTDKLKCPSWVKDKDAKKEFNRLLKELKAINAITNLDINSLAQYSVAFSGYIKATEELSTQPLTVLKETKAGTIVTANPLIKVQRDYADEMRKFAVMCGLTYDSRAKMADLIISSEKDQVKDEFGDI